MSNPFERTANATQQAHQNATQQQNDAAIALDAWMTTIHEPLHVQRFQSIFDSFAMLYNMRVHSVEHFPVQRGKNVLRHMNIKKFATSFRGLRADDATFSSLSTVALKHRIKPDQCYVEFDLITHEGPLGLSRQIAQTLRWHLVYHKPSLLGSRRDYEGESQKKFAPRPSTSVKQLYEGAIYLIDRFGQKYARKLADAGYLA